MRKTSRSTWNDDVQDELKVEGKEGVENWETIGQSKDSAVSKARAMKQQFRQQVGCFESSDTRVSV